MRTLRPLAAILLLVPALAHALEWQEIYTQDDVKVSRAEIEGSKLVSFKGDTVLDAPVGEVLHVLLDNEHRTDWVGRLYVSKIIEQHGPFDYVLYQAFELPAIFSNRDYVYHGVATRDPATGAVTLAMQSVEHPAAPETVGVRAELVDSRYVLTPQPGDRTRVEVEIVTDPKGMMPAWLVNLIQRSWPVETLSGIRNQLAMPWVTAHPLPGGALVAEPLSPATAVGRTAEVIEPPPQE